MRNVWWLLVVIVLLVLGAVDVWVHHRFVAPPEPKVPRATAYLVSLGDSVAAGDGLPAESPPRAPAACGLSAEAFPNFLAQNLGLPLQQFACAGAQISNGLLAAQTVGSDSRSAQLTRAKPYLAGSDVIITAGINDVGGLGLVQQCAQTSCNALAFTSQFETKLAQLKHNVAQAYSIIQAARPKKVVVNLYYPLVQNTDTCFTNYGVTGAKIAWINSHEQEVNATLQAAATQAGFQTVQIDFSGHLLCDPTPWIQGLFDPAPLHPTLAGQQQIARQDAQALR